MRKTADSLSTRRDFLKTTTAATLATALPGIAQTPAGEWRNRQPGMHYRRLGRTGYMVSEIVCGGGPTLPDIRHLEIGVEMGLSYFDTAPAYGNGSSEEMYGKFFATPSKRQQVFLNSKVSNLDLNRNSFYKEIYENLPETDRKRIDDEIREMQAERGVLEPEYFGIYFDAQYREMNDAYRANVMSRMYPDKADRRAMFTNQIIESVEASLRRLQTDHLDLLMCPHGASSPEELTVPEVFEAFRRLKREGKVRHFGFSAHSDPAGGLRTALKTGEYDAAMVAYNVGNAPWVDPVLEECLRNDFGVIAMKVARAVHPVWNLRSEPLPGLVERLHGLIPGDMSVPCKAFVRALQNPHLSAAVASIETIDMMRENMALPARARSLGLIG